MLDGIISDFDRCLHYQYRIEVVSCLYLRRTNLYRNIMSIASLKTLFERKIYNRDARIEIIKEISKLYLRFKKRHSQSRVSTKSSTFE